MGKAPLGIPQKEVERRDRKIRGRTRRRLRSDGVDLGGRRGRFVSRKRRRYDYLFTDLPSDELFNKNMADDK